VEVSGYELAPAARPLGPAPPAPRAAETLAGYYVLAAPDLARAARIAGTTPHLRHGGRVVVRPIVAH